MASSRPGSRYFHARRDQLDDLPVASEGEDQGDVDAATLGDHEDFVADGLQRWNIDKVADLHLDVRSRVWSQQQIEEVRREAYAAGYAAAMQVWDEFFPLPRAPAEVGL